MGDRVEDASGPVLLATKLRPPAVRDQVVPRERLLEPLRSGAGLGLSLVACPAGYGKTTLLASWHEAEAARKPVAWLTLDEGDNDPVVLWSYVIQARFRHPPRDLFGLAPLPHRNELRFRVWPETAVSLLLAGKKPGAGWEPQMDDLTFAQRPGDDMRPYDRLIGAALDGDRWLFARQDTVESAWRVVDPVLGDAVPVHPYARGSWGPKEADRLLPDRDTWHDPAG
jgi:Glucose-6-phosphate dehydrogenase, C-terminal domain